MKRRSSHVWGEPLAHVVMFLSGVEGISSTELGGRLGVSPSVALRLRRQVMGRAVPPAVRARGIARHQAGKIAKGLIARPLDEHEADVAQQLRDLGDSPAAIAELLDSSPCRVEQATRPPVRRCHVLSKAAAEEIRAVYGLPGASLRVLAARYGVSYETVRYAVHRTHGY